MAPELRWGHSDYVSPETWEGSYKTREAVIAAGRAEYGTETPFYIMSGVMANPADFMPDASWLLDDAGERASEAAHDAAEDWPPEPDAEALQELSDFLNAWARKHLPCRFWTADESDGERIDPEPSSLASEGGK